MATLIWTGTASGVFGTAGNWTVKSTGAASESAPANGDHLIVPAGATVDMLGGAYGETDPDDFVIEDGCGISIGTATLPLAIGATASAAWEWGGTGTYFFEVAGAAGLTSITIQGTGTYHLAGSGAEAIATGLVINNTSATVYLAWSPTEQAICDTVTSNGTLYLGTTVTTAAAAAIPLILTGGTATIKCSLASLHNTGATVTILGGTTTLLHNFSGTVYWAGATLTTAHVYTGAALDLTKKASAGTVTTVHLYDTATYNDPYSKASVGTVIYLNGTDTTRATVDIGPDVTFTTDVI